MSKKRSYLNIENLTIHSIHVSSGDNFLGQQGEVQASSEEENEEEEEDTKDGFPPDMPEHIKEILTHMGLSSKQAAEMSSKDFIGLGIRKEFENRGKQLRLIHDVLHSKIKDKEDVLSIIASVVCKKVMDLHDIIKSMAEGKESFNTPEAVEFVCDKLKIPIPGNAKWKQNWEDRADGEATKPPKEEFPIS